MSSFQWKCVNCEAVYDKPTEDCRGYCPECADKILMARCQKEMYYEILPKYGLTRLLKTLRDRVEADAHLSPIASERKGSLWRLSITLTDAVEQSESIPEDK